VDPRERAEEGDLRRKEIAQLRCVTTCAVQTSDIQDSVHRSRPLGAS
jgi:hypothetical protein